MPLMAIAWAWFGTVAAANPAPEVQIRPTFQASGEVAFRVYDDADEGVPYVAVTLRREGRVHEVRTDNQGSLVVTDLPRGTYDVQFRHSGFVTVFTVVEATVGRPEEPVHVVMPVGSPRDVVCQGACPERRGRRKR